MSKVSLTQSDEMSLISHSLDGGIPGHRVDKCISTEASLLHDLIDFLEVHGVHPLVR